MFWKLIQHHLPEWAEWLSSGRSRCLQAGWWPVVHRGSFIHTVLLFQGPLSTDALCVNASCLMQHIRLLSIQCPLCLVGIIRSLGVIGCLWVNLGVTGELASCCILGIATSRWFMGDNFQNEREAAVITCFWATGSTNYCQGFYPPHERQLSGHLKNSDLRGISFLKSSFGILPGNSWKYIQFGYLLIMGTFLIQPNQSIFHILW